MDFDDRSSGGYVRLGEAMYGEVDLSVARIEEVLDDTALELYRTLMAMDALAGNGEIRAALETLINVFFEKGRQHEQALLQESQAAVTSS